MVDKEEILCGLELCWEVEKVGFNKVGEFKIRIDELWIVVDKY